MTISDAAYHRLYAHCPRTTKGRARRAAFLIRHGRACTRAYDDCFENGDGGQVLAWLMQELRTRSPELRQMMQQQGAWAAEYDRVPDPKPFACTPDDRQFSLF